MAPELRFTDGRRLPVGKILCAARNYRSHAKEMGAEPPTEPVFFLKPATAVIHSGEEILLPRQSKDVQVETELAVILTRGGRNLTIQEAAEVIGVTENHLRVLLHRARAALRAQLESHNPFVRCGRER